MAGGCGLSTSLRSAAADYIAIRRAVGFKLRRPEGLLASFVEFLEAEQATRVTTQLALRWATVPSGATPGGWNSRLCVARLRPAHERHRPGHRGPARHLLARLGPGSCRAEPYQVSSHGRFVQGHIPAPGRVRPAANRQGCMAPPAVLRADTSRQTTCSPSCRACNYADQNPALAAADQVSHPAREAKPA